MLDVAALNKQEAFLLLHVSPTNAHTAMETAPRHYTQQSFRLSSGASISILVLANRRHSSLHPQNRPSTAGGSRSTKAGRKLLCGGGMARKPICPTPPSPSLVAVPGGGFGLALPYLPCGLQLVGRLSWMSPP